MGWLSAIPLIGRVFDLVQSGMSLVKDVFVKKIDADVEKYKVKGQIDVKAIEADVAIIQARTKLIEALKDDPAIKVARVWVLVPASIYFGVYFYYLAFSTLLPSVFIWKPLELPSSLDYVVYGIIALLCGTAWTGRK
jgi:hypothetical protein